MSDLIASTLGDYRIEALVGQGSSGQVFRAAHVYLGTPVALRIIDSRFTSSPGFKTRFVQYAQSLAGMTHPNLVKVYHCGEQDGLSYIVMELVSGGSLKVKPGDQAWSDAGWTVAKFVKQAADGLAAAHAQRITHGDVRISNLLLTRPDLADAQIKVSDVGLLRLIGDSGVTSRSLPSGLEGAAQDLVALGATFYELTTGRSAFTGAREFSGGTPERLKTIILRCLATDPGERFASCEELSKALGAAIDAPRQPQADAVAVPQEPSPAMNLKTMAVPAAGRRAPNPPRPPAAQPASGPKIPCIHVFDEAGTPVDTQFARVSGMTIGRAPSNGIVLMSPKVSATHVRIDWDARRVTVTDLGSSNGTLLHGQRLLPQVAQEWGREQWLQIGPFWLWLQRPTDEARALDTTEIMLDHQSKVMTLTPGKGAVCRVTLVNQKTQVDHVQLSVQGIPEEWVEGTTREVQLQPFEKREVTMAVNVPKSSAGRAGDYTVTIMARSAADPDAKPGSVTAHWTVLPFEAMGVSIAPARASGLRQARYTVTLHHDGNRPASYVLTGADEDKQLECLFSAEGHVDRNRLEVDLEPGTKTNVKLKVAAAKRWFGNSHAYAFGVAATPVDGQQSLTTEGQFTQRAIFPVWMLAVAPLVLLAIVFTLPRLFKPVVRTVYVEPRTPMTNEKVEIFWDASRASRVRLFVNELPVVPDPDPSVGKYAFPEGFDKDARVRVLASNFFGETPANATVTVRARPAIPADPARVELFEVRPLSIVPDQQVTIRWRVSGATRVDLNPIGTVDPEGSTTSSPPGNQTYTLTAYNKDERPTTRALTVQVRTPAPPDPSRLSLTILSPARKNRAGIIVVRVEREPLVFQWRVENAQKVRIESTTPVNLEGSSGQKSASLMGVGMYRFTLVATNSANKEFRSETVEVEATCSRSFFAEALTAGIAGCRKPPEVQWKN